MVDKCAKGYKNVGGKCVRSGNNSKKSKTRKGFDNALIFISLFGFLAIALNSFTEVNLSPWSTSVFMLVAGIALMIEGRIFTLREWGKDGIQPPEIPFIFTILFGVFTVVVGILAMPVINLVGEKLQVIIGLVAILCIAFISLQRWVFD